MKSKRLHIVYLSIIAFLTLVLGSVLFFHFDYIVFRQLISRHYIHTSTLDELFEMHIGERPSSYGRYFDNLVISIVTQAIRAHDGDVYTYQYNPRQRQARQERVLAVAAESYIVEVEPGVGLMNFRNFSRHSRGFVMDNRDLLASFDSLIIDLRGNLGGDLPALYDIAGLFIDRGDTIGYEDTRWRIFTRRRRASGRVLYYDQIVILQDHRTASSSESFIMALKENLDNVITIGTTSFGKGIGQITLPLRRGFAVRATIMQMQSPSGQNIQGVGITPDIYYHGEDIINLALSVID